MYQCTNTIQMFRNRSEQLYFHKYFIPQQKSISINELAQNSHMEEKHNNHEKFRLGMTDKRNSSIISRNECDGAFKDVSAVAKERKGKKVKKSQMMSIQSEMAKRRSQDEALIEKRQLQKQSLIVIGLAQAKAIIQDYPEIMKQSIEYLTNLVEQAQLSVIVKNALNKFSLDRYFTQLFSIGATQAFYKHSTALLNNRILDIIQEFHKSQLKYPHQMNIQIQILAHFFKSALEFQRFLPRYVQAHTLHLRMTVVTQVFKLTIEQISQIRRIYLQNSPKITYIEGFNLSSLANAYCFIMLKQKVLTVKYSVQLEDEINKAREQLKHHRAKTMEKEKFNKQFKGDEVLCQYSLSELYARRQTTKNERSSGEELLKKIETYERFIQLKNLTNIIGEKEIKTMTKWDYVDYDHFTKYYTKKNNLLEKNGGSLSKMKDEFITKQLIRNPYCSYEEVFFNVYHRYRFYIERSYFEGNVHRLLEKETHYQQLRYLEKLFKWAIQDKWKMNVIFADRCSLIEGTESSAIVTVSLAGALDCKKSLDGSKFLKEVKELLKDQQPSVVLLFDDEFPFSERLENTKEAFFIRNIHSLCFLPRISLVPNPCMMIFNSLKQILTEQCSLEEAISTALEEFDRPKVIEVAQKEWEKAQRLAYPDNPQCNQQQEQNKDEGADSNIEEGSDLEDSQDKDEEKVKEEYVKAEEYVKDEEDENENDGIKFIFPQQSREGFSSSTSQPVIIENLSGRFTSELNSP